MKFLVLFHFNIHLDSPGWLVATKLESSAIELLMATLSVWMDPLMPYLGQFRKTRAPTPAFVMVVPSIVGAGLRYNLFPSL